MQICRSDACAEGDGIGPGGDIDGILTVTGIENICVIAASACKCIISGTSGQNIVVLAAIQDVVASKSQED